MTTRRDEKPHAGRTPERPDEAPVMHDDILARTTCDAESRNRRETERVPLAAELIVIWASNPGAPIRYPIENVSAGGYMLRSSLPILEGETGTAVRTLPGEEINRPIMVAWSSPGKPFGGYHIGVQFLEPD